MAAYSNEIVATALRKVRAGKLPCANPGREFGGPGDHTPCDICDDPIEPKEMEIEAIYADFGTLHLHTSCMRALRAACAELQGQH